MVVISLFFSLTFTYLNEAGFLLCYILIDWGLENKIASCFCIEFTSIFLILCSLIFIYGPSERNVYFYQKFSLELWCYLPRKQKHGSRTSITSHLCGVLWKQTGRKFRSRLYLWISHAAERDRFSRCLMAIYLLSFSIFKTSEIFSIFLTGFFLRLQSHFFPQLQ